MEKPNALAQHLTLSALVSLLIVMSISSVHMLSASKAMQQTGRDYAEARHIRHGLLSVDGWSEKLTTLIDESYTRFRKSPELQSRLKPSLTKMLRTILILFEDRSRAQHAEPTILGVRIDDIFGARLATQVQRLKLKLIEGVFEQFRQYIPMLVDLILAELASMQPEVVSDFAKSLSEWINPQGLDGVDPRLTAISKRYECGSMTDEACQKQIQIRHQSARASIHFHSFLVLLCLFITCALMSIRKKHIRQLEMILILGIGTALWLSGILIPMISLEVCIDGLSFHLGNATIAFQDQVLFYQNKSVVDVVGLLLVNEKWSTNIVGLLVAVFSLVFPLFKIVGLTRMFFVPHGTQVNRVTYFFAMESSKYSMADVFVVALFMAYIGLDGLVGGQLDQLRDHPEPSTDIVVGAQGAQFEMGLFLFTGFCFFSIFLGRWVSKMRAEHAIRVSA